MKFSGFQKTSLVDYPNRISSVLFTPGCNLRCPFCHNHRISVDPKPPFLQEAWAIKILENRKKYVEAVVVTGGEPTIHNELPKFLKKLKNRGFKVKLDTNGFYPKILEDCLPFVDYVALDIKTSLEKYHYLGATNTDGLVRTIEMLKTGKVDFEFRTTIVPRIVEEYDIKKIGELIKGSKIYVFQQFVPRDLLDKKFETVRPYSPEKIVKFSEIMSNYVRNMIIRI